MSTHLAVFLAISRMSFQYFRGGMVWSRSLGIRMTSEPRLISIRVLAPRVFSKETRSWGHGRERHEWRGRNQVREREDKRERERKKQIKHRSCLTTITTVLHVHSNDHYHIHTTHIAHKDSHRLDRGVESQQTLKPTPSLWLYREPPGT